MKYHVVRAKGFSPLVASFLAFLLARRGHEEIGPGGEDGVADFFRRRKLSREDSDADAD